MWLANKIVQTISHIRKINSMVVVLNKQKPANMTLKLVPFEINNFKETEYHRQGSVINMDPRRWIRKLRHTAG